MIIVCKQREGLWEFVRRNDIAMKFVRRIVCLPLCRATAIPGLVERLRLWLDANRVQRSDDLLDLLRHFETAYLDVYGANTLSVYGSPHRTNNAVESAHRQLASRLSVNRPGFHRFLGKHV